MQALHTPPAAWPMPLGPLMSRYSYLVLLWGHGAGTASRLLPFIGQHFFFLCVCVYIEDIITVGLHGLLCWSGCRIHYSPQILKTAFPNNHGFPFATALPTGTPRGTRQEYYQESKSKKVKLQENVQRLPWTRGPCLNIDGLLSRSSTRVYNRWHNHWRLKCEQVDLQVTVIRFPINDQFAPPTLGARIGLE